MFTKYNFAIGGLLPSDPDSLLPSAAGVFVSPERTAETDGHQIVVVSTPESQPTLFDNPDGMEEAEFFTPFLMDRDSAIQISKMIPKRNKDAPENSMAMLDVHTEAESDSTVAITEDIRRSIFKSLKRDASGFPDIDKIIPSEESAKFEIQFNADVLVPVLRQLQTFAGDGSTQASITVRLYGAASAIRIDAQGPDQQRMTAVLMPLRQVEAPTEV